MALLIFVIAFRSFILAKSPFSKLIRLSHLNQISLILFPKPLIIPHLNLALFILPFPFKTGINSEFDFFVSFLKSDLALSFRFGSHRNTQ